MARRGTGAAWVAASDQAGAAAREVARQASAAHQAAVAAGLVPWANETCGVALGPALRVLGALEDRLTVGDFDLCEHGARIGLPASLGGPLPPPCLVWMSWAPRLLVCPPCAPRVRPASPEEDRRCDGCLRVTDPGEPMVTCQDVLPAIPDPDRPPGALWPPLVAAFGLCEACARASDRGPS